MTHPSTRSNSSNRSQESYFFNPYHPSRSQTYIKQPETYTPHHQDFATQTTEPALPNLQLVYFRHFCSTQVFNRIYHKQKIPENRRERLIREISGYYQNLFQQNIFENKEMFCEATSYVLRCFSTLMKQDQLAQEEEKLWILYQTIVVTRMESKQEIDEQAFRTILQILSKNNNQFRIREACDQYAQILDETQRNDSLTPQNRAIGIRLSSQEMIKRGLQFNDIRIFDLGRRILRQNENFTKTT